MTVEIRVPSITYNGNGTAAPLAVPFRFLASRDLIVTAITADNVETPLVRGTDYSVQGAGASEGGSVTPISPIAIDMRWRIDRSTPLEQPTKYEEGFYSAAAQEMGLDRQMLALQEVSRDVDDLDQRSLRAYRVKAGQTTKAVNKADFVGKFFTGGPDGEMIPADGTGADLGLRTDLVQPDGGRRIGFRLGANGIIRDMDAKLQEVVATIGDFGGVGEGMEDDAVLRAEASNAAYVDLLGLTVTTSLNANGLTKGYFNGELRANADGQGRYIAIANRTAFADDEIARRRTKSPILDWRGKSLLWLGTSIPAYGFVEQNSYPDLFAQGLGATVDVQAWPGSHASFAGLAAYAELTTDGQRLSHILSLSMTEDDRLAGVALYGAGSAYSDSASAILGINLPSQQTADYRIKARYAAGPIDAVFFDHCHNDALQPPGDDSYETLAITGITKGADTVITVANIGSIAVGDGIILRVTGIAKLDHHACRVQAVAGNNITISLDSGGMSGTFAAGTLMKVDRNTLWGAYEFIIHYNFWCAILYGRPAPKIIMSSPPSAWSEFARNEQMHSTAEVLKDVAEKWDFSFFDGLYLYDVKLHDQPTFLSDGTHPATIPERQAYANLWMEWAQGGTVRTRNPDDYLPAGDTSFTDMREPVYDEFLGGFGTPSYRIGSYSDVLSDDFADGNYTGWTANGTAPTVVTAPWDAGLKAVRCSTTGMSLSYLSRAAALDDVSQQAVILCLPVTSGLVPAGQIVTVTHSQLINATGGIVATINLIVTDATVKARMEYFTGPADTGLVVVPNSEVELEPGVPYALVLKELMADAGYLGAVLFMVNGKVVARQSGIDTSTQTVPASVKIGICYKGASVDLDLYFATPQFGKKVAALSASRFTGSITGGSSSLEVVNGIVVGAGGGGTIGGLTSVAASGGTTGLSFSGSPITTSGTLTLGGTLGVANGGTGSTTAAAARTALGCGTIATQNSNAIAITGGTIAGVSSFALNGSLIAGTSSPCQIFGDISMLAAGANAWHFNGYFTSNFKANAAGYAAAVRFDQSSGAIQFWTAPSSVAAGANSGIATTISLLSNRIEPGVDNSVDLGTASLRMKTIYAATGTINTSDARLKRDIRPIDDKLLDAWADVEWVQFRFIDAYEEKGENARWHMGLIAQQVRDAIDAHLGEGSAVRFGLVCYDAWEAQPEELAAEMEAVEVEEEYVETVLVGKVRKDGTRRTKEVTKKRKVAVDRPTGRMITIRPAREAGDRWGLRYEECLDIEAAFQRRRMARIEARLEQLAA